MVKPVSRDITAARQRWPLALPQEAMIAGIATEGAQVR
jgi:hypothetical protein